MRIVFRAIAGALFFTAFSVLAQATAFNGDINSERRHRPAPKIISSDEARQAAEKLTHSEGSSGAELSDAAASEADKPSPPAVETPSPQPAAAVKLLPVAEPPAQAGKANQVHEVTDAELGPPPSKEKLMETIKEYQNEDGSFDPVKMARLRKKVDDAIESSSPEQKAMLLNMQQQVNETVARLVRARQEQASKNNEK